MQKQNKTQKENAVNKQLYKKKAKQKQSIITHCRLLILWYPFFLGLPVSMQKLMYKGMLLLPQNISNSNIIHTISP